MSTQAAPSLHYEYRRGASATTQNTCKLIMVTMFMC